LAGEIPIEDHIVVTGGIPMSTHDAEFSRHSRRARGILAHLIHRTGGHIYVAYR
jgi:hypothetical protein